MEDLKQLIAANLVYFRKENHLTQAELAEKINYSDKVISKWERAESTPDVLILHQLAQIYDIRVDRFLQTEEQAALDNAPDQSSREDASLPAAESDGSKLPRRMNHNQRIIVLLSLILVWFLALLGFVICWALTRPHLYFWFAFACAVPVSLIVLLVLNSIWGTAHHNLYIISMLMWSLLATVFTGLWPFRLWPLFLLGIPGQLAIILSFGFRRLPKKNQG